MYVIVGFGPTGVAAIEGIRKCDTQSPITIIGEEAYSFYSRLLLEQVASGTLSDEQIVMRKEQFYQDNHVTCLKGRKAVSLDTTTKHVILDDGTTQEYSKLLIATGARSKRLGGLEGITGIFNLYTLKDALAVRSYCAHAHHAVVIGAGFVGTDWLKSLVRKGIDTTLLVRGKGMFYRSLPESAVALIHQKLEEKGVHVMTEDELDHVIAPNNTIEAIITRKGATIPCDLLGLGVGVTRNLELVKESGMHIEEGIMTNEYLQTSIADIYAAGDIAKYYDLYTKAYILSGIWQNALKMGTVAGMNMAGVRTVFQQVYFQSLNIFDIGYISVGILPRKGIEGEVKESLQDGLFIQEHSVDGKLIGAVLVGKNASFEASKRKVIIEMNLAAQH